MTYAGYVFAAYAVFAIVLLWDFVAPHLRIHRQWRAIRRLAARRAAISPAEQELKR